MRRRELIFLLGGAAITWPLAAESNAGDGFLNNASPGPFAPYAAAFRLGLSETGYVEGKNLAIEYRWAEGQFDRLPALAADLVIGKVDVIASFGGFPAVAAAKRASSRLGDTSGIHGSVALADCGRALADFPSLRP